MSRARAWSLFGKSACMEGVRNIITQLAPSPFPVLVTGSRGTGKELVAQEIHERSTRRSGPFIVVDCGALPQSLAESELFGHEAGSFTGAIKERMGLLEMANSGTLFLDEIGNMPVEVQAKLLRFLEDQKIRRIGGRGWIQVDARVVAATNMDLAMAIQEKRFLPDLYDRLSVLTIELPDLENRREDILLLAQKFIKDAAHKLKKELVLKDEVKGYLTSRPYPGNVRELRNLIYRLAAMADGDEITLELVERVDPRMKGTTVTANVH